VCIVGPTASGKTALAIEVAEALGAEIVSVDSRQVYRRMDVGTAKPSVAERARVRHHCLDLVDPGDAFDAARFRDAASAALTDVAARGKHALVVGGTGLWLRALLGGLCGAPPRVPALRALLMSVAAAEGVPVLHGRLAEVDPPAAARIHPNDGVRIVRALEVAEASGRRLSDWQAAHRFAERPWEALVIGLDIPVAVLDARIEARTRRMVVDGFLDEVHALCAEGLAAAAPGWGAVGYREMRACVTGASTIDEAVAATVRATRQLAKRQRTWFRREPGIRWREPTTDRSRLLDETEEFLS
jgi:tRNA dimethylallyltransferase